MCDAALIFTIGRACGISICLKKITNVNFTPKVCSFDLTTIVSGSSDILVLLPNERICHGELISYWAEGNPGWAFAPPN